jgi:hypothetical protein
MFLANKYTSWYNSIINNATGRLLPPNIYLERHHIIPDCFYIKNRSKGKRPGWLQGNPNDPANIVKLTAKEHFMCHWLLTKMTTGEAMHLMLYALSGMHRGRDLSAAQYAIIKEASSRLRKGVKVPKHVVQKAVATRRRNGSYVNTPESNSKRSAKLKGRTIPDSQKLYLKNLRTGSKLSEDSITKRTQTRKEQGVNHNIEGFKKGWENNANRLADGSHHLLGNSNPSHKRLEQGTHNFTQVHICPHCAKEGKGPQMKRYHFDNCKSQP